MAILLPNGKQAFVTSAGVPLAGGRLYTYAAGTSISQATYQDSAGATPHTNPVILDARGERQIYWDGAYDVILRDASDALIWGPERLDSTGYGNGGTGGTGTAGASGNSTGIAYLYQWSTTQPANPTGTSSYTWATAVHDNYSGVDGWTTVVPGNPGTPGVLLWVASKPLSAAATVATTLVSWTTGFTVAAWTQNGATGTAGAPGLKTAQPEVYQWAATIPAGPTGTSTYTWSTLTFTSVPAGWNAAPGASPSPGYTLWAAVVPISEGAGQATTVFNWTIASVMARGYAGTNGTTGNFIAYVFKRAASVPATPTGNGIPPGWSDAPPTADGNPLFMSKAEQSSTGTTVGAWSTPVQLDGTGGTVGPTGGQGDSISVEYSINGATSWHSTFTTGDLYMRQKVGAGSWSTAIRIVGETGAAGNFVDHIFKRAATVPATPTGDGTPAGWFDAPPADDGNPLWMSVATKTYADVLVGAWGTPSAISGPAGATGTTGSSISVEYSVDGSTSWHATFTTGDLYMHQRVGAGAWSSAIRIVGEAGIAGTTGSAGASYRLAYAKVTGSSLGTSPSNVTTSGSSSFPPTSSWGGGEVWSGTVPTFAAGESIFQTDGIYSPGTGNTVWGVPYLSSLKVGSLSAISANLGTITSGNITLDSASSIKGGQTAYDTGTGFFLGYSSGAYKLSIGSGANSLKWDGSILTVPAANITGQVITTQIAPGAVNTLIAAATAANTGNLTNSAFQTTSPVTLISSFTGTGAECVLSVKVDIEIGAIQSASVTSMMLSINISRSGIGVFTGGRMRVGKQPFGSGAFGTVACFPVIKKFNPGTSAQSYTMYIGVTFYDSSGAQVVPGTPVPTFSYYVDGYLQEIKV